MKKLDDKKANPKVSKMSATDTYNLYKSTASPAERKEFEKIDKSQKINTLAMISPVTNEEKQKLLEAVSIGEKIKILDNIINFYLHDVSFNNQTIQ